MSRLHDSQTKQRRALKITVVGDGNVGKTCMLISFTNRNFPSEYVPTVFDTHQTNLTVDGVEFSLTLWDTAGQEAYDKLRPLSYPKTDCFVLCYSVNSQSSLDNVELKWIPELKHHNPKTSVILVGTKIDLYDSTSPESVTEKQGKKMKAKVKAERHVLCSSKTGEGLNEIFIEAVRAAMRKKRHDEGSFCQFL